jgi:branched-chain amino acid transport system substrate-binding protein
VRKFAFVFAVVSVVGILLAGQVLAAEPIRIGLQAPITGSFAIEGQMAKQCVELAAELINQQGGDKWPSH